MHREADLDAELLASTILNLLRNADELDRMAAAMKKMGRPEATQGILDSCMELIVGD
jgi:UDP-N-acetylglucosamine:LPS N-acetylglucosamine transferase